MRISPFTVVFDTLELVFGPDPGLIRLKIATRAVVSAAVAMVVLLLVTGGKSREAIAAVALGFMMASISNVAVRDSGRAQQATTLGLLAVPALGAITIASYLSSWPLVAELAFVVVVTLSALARMLGPRGMALGFVGFIAYFIGEITHPALRSMPLLALGVAAGLGASALMRFVVLPDDPLATMYHVARHLRRRVARICAQAGALLSAGQRGEVHERQMHRELARLNDAFQTAVEQVEAASRNASASTLRDRMLSVELAAERVLRIAGSARDGSASRDAARLASLAETLRSGRWPTPHDTNKPEGTPARVGEAPLGAALSVLEYALAALAREMK